ncbi:uncharacterized protein LOC142982266 [Anticarsia gemmatalis]|uniref:uncharacterized protein LOC142982266 n=1 Tax=Anticarsia gemmatalis TaxID=129554 RepID=UPI003F775815
MFAHYLILYLILMLFTRSVITQVCNEPIKVPGRIVSYSRSYLVRRPSICQQNEYYDDDEYYDYSSTPCIKTFTESRRFTKLETKYETRHKCCDGYAPGPPRHTTVDVGLICDPVCEPPCGHGTCASPNTCVCHNGYKLVNGTCKPDCSGDCSPGFCSAPHTCQCPPDYYQQTWQWMVRGIEHYCVTHCRIPCGKGLCVSRDVCKCFDGFVLNTRLATRDISSGLCVPRCDNCTETRTNAVTASVVSSSTRREVYDESSTSRAAETGAETAAGSRYYSHDDITSPLPTTAKSKLSSTDEDEASTLGAEGSTVESARTSGTSYRTDALQQTWWSRWWWCVVAPVVVVLCGALVLALRRRQGPLVACFSGRYDVQGDLPVKFKECHRVRFGNKQATTVTNDRALDSPICFVSD